MFTNKNLNVAFLISLTWHLVCMFSVNIVVLPGKYRVRDLTSVSFLGPILGSTALEIMLADKPVGVTTTYQRPLRYQHDFGERRMPALKDEGKNYIKSRMESSIGMAFRNALRARKETPQRTKGSRLAQAHLKNPAGNANPPLEREVIYKPNIPGFSPLVAKEMPFALELEFLVSNQGEVKDIVPVVSSGNPEADLLGIRYLKGWKFTPDSRIMKNEQKGRIKLVFEEYGKSARIIKQDLLLDPHVR